MQMKFITVFIQSITVLMQEHHDSHAEHRRFHKKTMRSEKRVF